MDYKYPTAFSKWDREEYAAINNVIHFNQFTMGPRVAEFEQAFAAAHLRKHAIMVNSGSSANLIAVAALADMGFFKQGDIAAVPAIAWSTTYAPLIQYGLRLHLLDVDDTWNAPVAPVPAGTALIVGCSILGNPAYLAEWEDLAKSRGVPLLEDNCESFGALTPEKNYCGTYGFMSTFSFFYSHQISAIEGGMILTDDDGAANLCRVLRAHGWTRDLYKAKKFKDEYNFIGFGYNVRPLEMHAAVGLPQLLKMNNFREARVANRDYFERQCLYHKLPITPQRYRGTVNPFGLSFLVPNEGDRQLLADAFRAAGVDCRLPTGGSFRLHHYGKDYKDQKTPVADHVHRCGMFLGNAPYDIRELIDIAINVLVEFYNG